MITAYLSKPVHIAAFKKNATDWPKEYTCNFLEPGVVSYEDCGQGIAMLPSETIDKMLQSFIGKPVVIDHVDVTPATFKKAAVGYVTKVWRESNGWAYCTFILTDDNAKELVAKGFSVSCAFDVHEVGPGGEWHAIKFDEEIQLGEFTHLALVDNPRYEACRIFTNSKGSAKINKENAVMTSTHVDAGKRVEIKDGMFSGKKGTVQVSDGKHMIVVFDRGEGSAELATSQIRFLNSKEISQVETTHSAKLNSAESNTQEKFKMKFKFWAKDEKKNEKKPFEKDPSKIFVNVDGKQVSVQQLMNAKKKAAETEETLKLENSFTDSEGAEHNLDELIVNYRNSNMTEEERENAAKDEEEKKNAADDEEKKKKEDAKRKAAKEDEEKKNAADEEEKKKNAAEDEEEKKRKAAKEDEEKKNARRSGKDGHTFYEKVKGMRENAETGLPGVLVETMNSKCSRGEEMFGRENK